MFITNPGRVGDDLFNSFIKDFYNKYYLKTVNTEEILNLISCYDKEQKTQEIINFYFK